MATLDISPYAHVILRHIATTLPPAPVEDLVRFSQADGDFAAAKLAARKNLDAVVELIRAGLASMVVEDDWSPASGSDLHELSDEMIDQIEADEETKEALMSGREDGALGPVEIVTNSDAFERAKPQVVVTATRWGHMFINK